MGIIKEQYDRVVIKSQESFLNLESKKRIELMLQHVDTAPSDILLDVGGNTGRLTEVYAKDCKEIVVLEPKYTVVEYGRKYRPHIKFVEGRVENIPFPSEYFDKVVASASFPKPGQGFGRDEENIKTQRTDDNS